MTAGNIIDRNEARTLVGKMLFGADWIPALTNTESKLLNSDFGPKRRPVFRDSAVIKWIDVFECACPADQRDEFDTAIGRLERMRIQGATVDDWIEVVAGLDLTEQLLDRCILDAAMQQRQQQADEAASVNRRGPKPLKTDSVAASMKADIQAGKFTASDLRGFTQDAIAATYSVSREIAVNARNKVLSEF